MKKNVLHFILILTSSIASSAEISTINGTLCQRREDINNFIFMAVGYEECSSVRGKNDDLCKNFYTQGRKISLEKCQQIKGTYPIVRHDEYSGRKGERKVIRLVQVNVNGKRYWSINPEK